MTKKEVVRIAAIVLAVMMPLLSATLAFSASGESGAKSGFTTDTKYANPNINVLTGHGEEPEELSVSAAATYQEKAWYEYVVYSEHAVSTYRMSDESRLLFFDPYTYTNSMVMDVQFDAATTEFDTMSSYTISKTSSRTFSSATTSTRTSSTATQESGRDITHSNVTNNGSTKTIFNHSTDASVHGEIIGENRFTHEVFESATELGTKDGLIGIIATETIKIGIDTTQQHNNTSYKDYGTTTTYTGSDTVEYNNGSTTEGWTELSARVTKTIGSSSSINEGWSETNGTTVTKTYAATHFASDGITPLPWAIVHYQVQMPMKCCLQVRYNGEWVTLSTIYCMLTTVQGTCRAWMQNGQVYYEDWGNGEPVVASDFWSQFTTKDNLIKAYNDKLYPVGGEN